METITCNQPRMSSKKEFIALPENGALFKRIKECAICCCICAAITLIFGIATGNYFGVVDVLLLVGLGLAIHLSQNKFYAIILAVYATINAVWSIAEDGKVRGWLIILAAAYACNATFKLDRAWKKYREEIPEQAL